MTGNVWPNVSLQSAGSTQAIRKAKDTVTREAIQVDMP